MLPVSHTTEGIPGIPGGKKHKKNFSKLKQMKNYIQSIVGILRLRNVAILSLELKIKDQIVFDNVNEEFANRKEEKLRGTKLQFPFPFLI